ncbi:hypothetical protein [Sphaerimonospora thailandensis]|uniref:Uncharacterized protein n=1 Tax=Sphaerimonospora thailandensis TaxID=795644 RepID=A0A8J3R4L2_9ACTN|nr:hypothetical protein [Sphaerimonospora thailandensis]GIH68335.1 hypothetical protein Mth01_05880 [Sphaerimonospora thailandensis]
MKRTLTGLAAAAIAGLAVTAPLTLMAGPASATDYGPDTCLQGYVWREARVGDVVCVTPATRAQTKADNSVAAARWTDGVYGPHTCVTGYVWREAYNGDDVCVTPQTRTQAKADNKLDDERKVKARLWITRYFRAYGVDDTQLIKINGDHFNFGMVRLTIRYNTGKLFWSGTVNAKAHAKFAGGAFGLKTDVVDCAYTRRPANAYIQAQDVVSGRQSARIPVRVGCLVL